MSMPPSPRSSAHDGESFSAGGARPLAPTALTETTGSVARESGDAHPLRWLILGLIVAATALNYVDRQLIALVKPLLQATFHWSDLDYADVLSAFQLSVAAACLLAGWVIDRIGLRLGYALSVGAWSLAGMAQAVAASMGGFLSARVALGIAEAGNTPAAIKALALWFPAKERSLAVGFFNAAANLGAVVTPLIVPPLVARFGWRGAFVLTGLGGLVWVLFWWPLSGRAAAAHPGACPAAVTAAEPAARIAQLLRDRRVWAFAGAKGLTDPVWWFFLFWFPDLLNSKYGLGLAGFGPPLAVVYLLACVGALGGGWLTDRLIERLGNIGRARKIMLFVAALAVMPIPAALSVHDYWTLTAIVGVALAAHQCYATNLFALAQDLYPENALGSVSGIGATVGLLGGMVMLEVSGWVLTRTHHYWPMFAYGAGAYMAGLLLLHGLIPRIDRAADASRPA